ncbi:MAG: radical SAM protein [Clostridia bacterium]|nr:radical SAM protein [Clostridia bacterium]
MEINVYDKEYKVYLHPSKQKFLLVQNTNDHIISAEQQIIMKQRGYLYFQPIAPNVLTVFFIPGWQCNMKCVYCFANNSKIRGIDVAERGIYIDAYRKKYNYRIINIVFFGGEPSLYLQECISLYSSLNDLFKNQDVELHYSIVTNGYDITNEFIDFCLKIDIANIQITIDCGKEYHDKYRKSINNEDTYEQIITNTNRLLGFELPLTIRTNVNNENVCQIHSICDDLIKLCNGRKIDWSIAPIMNTDYRQEQSFQTSIVKPYIKSICERLSSESIRLIPWMSNCDFFGNSVIVLNCDGKIYNCVNLCKHNYSIDKIYLLKSRADLSHCCNALKCDSCFWEYMCGGGCKYQNFIKNGSFNLPYCLKNIYDSLVMPIIEQKALNYLSNSSYNPIALEIYF